MIRKLLGTMLCAMLLLVGTNAFGQRLAHGVAGEESKPGEAGTAWVGNTYPVPVRTKLFVPVNLIKSGTVQVALYDLLGSKVADLVNTRYEPGTHTLEAIITHLDNGQYFVMVDQDHHRLSTQKIVILK